MSIIVIDIITKMTCYLQMDEICGNRKLKKKARDTKISKVVFRKLWLLVRDAFKIGADKVDTILTYLNPYFGNKAIKIYNDILLQIAIKSLRLKGLLSVQFYVSLFMRPVCLRLY
jgi:hypothetical protein